MDRAAIDLQAPLILVVDDEQDVRLLLRKELEACGFLVEEASSGESALQRLKITEPDLVLMDVMMPKMDGIATCQVMRDQPEYQNLPILMLTGMDGLDYVRQAFDAGATDFINKTTNLGMVSQRIRYALRNHMQKDALFSSRSQLELAQRVAKLGYWKLDIQTSRLTLSDQARVVLGYGPAQFDSTLNTYLNLIHIQDQEKVRSAIDCAIWQSDPFEIDYRVLDSRGSKRFIHTQGDVIVDDNGKAVSVLGTVQDITELKRSESTFEHMALYDSLTDLCNRHLFLNRLEHVMASAHRDEKLLAVCFIDLDGFKKINDNLGHAIGDELLKSVAKHLKNNVRKGDIVARLSGDEFALAIEGINSVEELEKIIGKISKKLSQPHRIRGHEVLSPASIGVTLYPLDSSTKTDLIKNADAAMYRAKQLGGDQYCFYTHDMRDRTHRRLELERHLRHALGKGQLRVYYQPQVDVKTGKIAGVEALLRWQHPDYGLLSPVKFIHIAEETGLIFPIGLWLMETAFQQLQQWHSQGFGQLRVAVNLSARQFLQRDITQNLRTIMQNTHFDAQYLSVEITESVAMNNIEGATRVVEQFKALGAQVSIDDFGAGHSSMNHLQRLAVDSLNIDRSFVMNIAGREKDGATAKAIIGLAHGLGLRVIAEGVETPTQVEFLKSQDCDELQGHHFSPPVPAEQMTQFLATHQ
jgi:diguanylate cyclase (GGDEF)-like protein/PAS domain S-box-containing protein